MTEHTVPGADPDLKIREELLSINAINPFVATSSSARCIMMGGHISQIVVIDNGRPQIIQTGLETQLAENTFSCKLDHDSRIIAILRRYHGISINSVTTTTEHLVVAQDIETHCLDIISIPYYHKLHQHFGFKYKINEDNLTPPNIGTVLPKGTVFADTPTVSKDMEYSFGHPVNLVYMSVPEVTGDGVVISESLAEKYTFRTYETIVVEFGEKTFPLNLYGDDNNYKPFPDIGEYINDDRVIIATREYDSLLAPVLVSKEAVKDYSVYFDKPFYSKSTGGKIVDIKVYHNVKSRKSTYTETTTQVDRYATALKQHYTDIIQVYEEQAAIYYSKYRTDMPVTERLHRLLMDAYAVVETKHSVRYTYKNDPVDLYRVEFVIEHKITPNRHGFKTTTLHGSKGVVVDVRPDNLMPVDSNGVRAEMIMDPTSITGRMNPSNLYEHYFSGISRKIKSIVSAEIDSCGGLEGMSESNIVRLFDIVLGGIKLFGTEQYVEYCSANINDKLEILEDIYENECYIYYKVSSETKPYQVVVNAEGTIYEPIATPVTISSVDNPTPVVTDAEFLIAPQYIILLAKTADSYLATSSAKTNHFDLPVSTGPKIRQNIPYRNSPVKVLSETEGRLYSAYVGRKGLAELKDRANSVTTHKLVYTNILKAERPTDIDVLVDRNVHPFGSDKAIELASSILNASGINLKYAAEKNRIK